MEKLRHGQPGPHECWEELAEHSLSHYDHCPRRHWLRRLVPHWHRRVR
jgi:hypothetical protein